MSDLEKALEWVRRGNEWSSDEEPLLSIIDAARRFANLTSPETIEKAAKAHHDHVGHYLAWEKCHDIYKDRIRSIAEVVLRSVEEGTQ